MAQTVAQYIRTAKELGMIQSQDIDSMGMSLNDLQRSKEYSQSSHFVVYDLVDAMTALYEPRAVNYVRKNRFVETVSSIANNLRSRN